MSEYAQNLRGTAMLALERYEYHQNKAYSGPVDERQVQEGRAQAYALIVAHITGQDPRQNHPKAREMVNNDVLWS
jgi:hypothetical protein